eukprot:1150885-Rhodomonas_salina.4
MGEHYQKRARTHAGEGMVEGQHQKGAFDALLLHRIFHVLHSRFELVHIFVVLGNHIVDQTSRGAAGPADMERSSVRQCTSHGNNDPVARQCRSSWLSCGTDPQSGSVRR